ncbi:MAG TPA: polyphosphate kinase 1 [Rhodothermales bacterium]|nr:polyphosphate kinase 1 [Rhodothermales bacterium]
MAPPPLFDRELSWLQFNERVLQEAADPRVPLNERLNFLAIFSSNLDEFVRVRVAALRALVRLKKKDRKALDFSPPKLLRQIQRTIGQQQERYGEVLRREVLPGIEAHGVALRDDRHLAPAEAAWVRAYFLREVAPLLHPHFLDEYADPAEGGATAPDAPFLENGRLYLVAELWPRDEAANPLSTDGPTHALVGIPSPPLPRFVEVPAEAYGDGEAHNRVVLFLDDVVRLGLADLFPGYEIGDAYAVKLSRDADLYVDDEFTGDLVEKIVKGLDRRQAGVPSRFLYDPRASYGTVTLLKKRLGLEDEDLTSGGRYHNLADLWTFPRPTDEALSYPAFPPLPHPSLSKEGSVLAAMKVRDRVIHLPYQSYEPVVRFLDEAAADAAVEDVWATLYRVAKDSAVVGALCRAAEAGKQVTAFVEVKARFDEAQNLEMAERMEAAGVRVHYSMPGLKVHAKILLAGRREGSALVDYAALSTGNFNEKTARIYADHVLLTADPRLTADAREVFRFLIGEVEKPVTHHLLVAPFTLASGLFELVDNEIRRRANGEPARVTLKMNSIEDEEAVAKLYEASKAGVQVDLVVRGLSRLVSGAEGWSEGIAARSIVDRFLEHARVYRFLDGGANRLYLASADWMRRNLRRRVEVAFPLYDPEVREEVLALLELQLADDVKARVLDPAQSNRYVEPAKPRGLRAQWESYRLLRMLAETAGVLEPEGDLPTELASDW